MIGGPVKSTVLLLRITTTFSGPNDMFIAVLGPLMRPQLYKSPPTVCTDLKHQLNPFTSLLFYQWIFQVWRQFTWCFVTLQQYLRPVSEDTAKSDGGDCFKLGITGLETGKICLYNSSLILRPPLVTDTINGLFNRVLFRFRFSFIQSLYCSFWKVYVDRMSTGLLIDIVRSCKFLL